MQNLADLFLKDLKQLNLAIIRYYYIILAMIIL